MRPGGQAHTLYVLNTRMRRHMLFFCGFYVELAISAMLPQQPNMSYLAIGSNENLSERKHTKM